MIRNARKEDVQVIFSLVETLEEDSFDKTQFIEKYNRLLESDIYHCLVYECEKIVAYLFYMIKEPLHHHKKTIELLELCVDNAYRSKHIGKQLLDYLEDIARKDNIEEIELSSNIKRKDAHRFYQKNGYVLDHYNFRKELL